MIAAAATAGAGAERRARTPTDASRRIEAWARGPTPCSSRRSGRRSTRTPYAGAPSPDRRCWERHQEDRRRLRAQRERREPHVSTVSPRVDASKPTRTVDTKATTGGIAGTVTGDNGSTRQNKNRSSGAVLRTNRVPRSMNCRPASVHRGAKVDPTGIALERQAAHLTAGVDDLQVCGNPDTPPCHLRIDGDGRLFGRYAVSQAHVEPDLVERFSVAASGGAPRWSIADWYESND